ncbi:hypothetical protein [Halobellus sp. GM3]
MDLDDPTDRDALLGSTEEETVDHLFEEYVRTESFSATTGPADGG